MINFFKYLNNRQDFEAGGILSERVHIPYRAESHDPWLVFNDPIGIASFMAHRLELGSEEFDFWNGVVQRQESIKLNGFINRLYHVEMKLNQKRFGVSIGYIRGYLESPGNPHKTGLWVGGGRVVPGSLKTNQQLERAREIVYIPVMNMVFHQIRNAEAKGEFPVHREDLYDSID